MDCLYVLYHLMCGLREADIIWPGRGRLLYCFRTALVFIVAILKCVCMNQKIQRWSFCGKRLGLGTHIPYLSVGSLLVFRSPITTRSVRTLSTDYGMVLPSYLLLRKGVGGLPQNYPRICKDVVGCPWNRVRIIYFTKVDFTHNSQ